MNLPVLASCNIRLGRDCDPSLQSLARNAATRAMGQQTSESIPQRPFRFLDLPQGLQYKILGYTDLITPCREVTWNPREGFYLHYDVLFCEDKYCISKGHPNTCQFRNCHQRRDNGCFCNRHHSVFSTICTCWCPPTALFLVSKPFAHHAQSIFFSKNRFIIMPSAEKFYLPPAHSPARLETSIFLCDFMAPDMLYHLRFLELVFPPIEGKEPGYISANSPAHHDWTEAIAYARDKLNLPSLTIRIYSQDFRTYKEASRHRRSASLTREECMRTIVAVYELLVSPLSQLAGNKENKNGLGRCFVHAAWPWAWTPDTLLQAVNGNDDGVRWAMRDQREIERGLERRVMADDAYDGTAMGKKIMMWKSQWLEFYDLHLVGFRFDGFEGIEQDPWFLGSDDDDDDDGF